MSYCLSFGDGQHSSIVMQEICSVMILSSSSAVSQNNHLTDGYEQTHIHRDHSFKTSACLRGGGVSLCADGQKVTVHKDQKFPS